MAESAQMPRYVCHKTVHALKITNIDVRLEKGMPIILTPEDKRYAPIEVTQDWARERHVERPAGYYVVYEDGYTSWSPVETFEKGYTPIADGISDINSTPLPKLSGISPWVKTVRDLLEALRPAYEQNTLTPFADETFKAAERLLKNGVSLDSIGKA